MADCEVVWYGYTHKLGRDIAVNRARGISTETKFPSTPWYRVCQGHIDFIKNLIEAGEWELEDPLKVDIETVAEPSEAVNHPPHYTQNPSGVECIQVTEHMTFNLGNAVKYIWRFGLKEGKGLQDLEKAIWYLNREIKRLKKNA